MPFPQVGLVPRRRKVGNACTFCREHRVRCEAVTPCPPCVANNVTCIRSRPQTPRRSRAKGSNGQHRQQEGRNSADTLLDGLQTVEESSPPTPSPSENLAWTSQKTDSILGFIARINAFCSGGPLQCSSTAPSSDPPFGQDMPFLSGIQETQATDCDLSPAQTRRITRMFWSHLRPLMPIVQWGEVNPEGTNRALLPLQDAVTVYTLQYIYNSGLHTRLAGLNWPQFPHWKSKIGLPYFHRALSAVTQLATFARPSIPVMQCYCYLTLYLLDAGQYQAAYIMVGLGLRIAQSLNYMDARNGKYRECRLFRHVWWTLIHLEFRCARHVGKPVTSRADGLVGLSPSREELDTECSGELAYHIETIRLTAAARAVNEAMDRHSLPNGISGLANIEARAEALSEHLGLLKQWRDELPHQKPFAKRQLDVVESPHLGDAQSTPQDTLADSPILTLQNTLLSLQYHNTAMTLHRTFIQFRSSSSNLNSSSNNTISKSTTLALTALHHAMTLTTLTHTRLSTHDIHHGHAEIYQYQWNAVITVIGFMLAYPFRRELCAQARGCLDLAMEVFTSAGGDTAAKRAAVLTGYLGRKVDGLVGGQDDQYVTSDHPPPPAAAVGPLHHSTTTVATMTSEEPEGRQQFQTQVSEPVQPVIPDQGVFTATTATTTALNTPNSPLLSTDGQPLWLWDELGNLDAWPTYCDEVFEAFMVDPEESSAQV